MFPPGPPQTHPVTRLWQVEREGNPLRRFGHVSPFIGKLGPLDLAALDRIGRLTRAALPALPQPTLVIGMTESSLLLAFFMARWQQSPVDLRFTTRKVRAGASKISFREPHSHGPQHFLALEAGRCYAQIVIIEDELTTGATLRNLILAVPQVSQRIFVVTLRDLRPPALREEQRREMQARGITLDVLSLESVIWNDDGGTQTPRAPKFNPFGRTSQHFLEARQQLERAFREFGPGAIYLVGECVDIALPFALDLAPGSRPELRQVTRSPWKVDGAAVRDAARFSGAPGGSRYFLYNFAPPANRRALWIAEACNAVVGAQLSEFLEGQGVASRGMVVGGT